jgi:protease I
MQIPELEGRRIAVLAADGFEKVEVTVPVNALRLAGARVDIVSLRHGRLRGVNIHEPASRVRVDRTLDEASADDYDGLLIPGGFISPDLLRQSASAREFVRAFDRTGKPIASLCHGPWLLISASVTQGRTLASWPGIRDDVVNSGAVWLDREVVRDGNWVTSRGPQDMVPFVQAMVELFADPSRVRDFEPLPSESSPQHDEPPKALISAMKWLPRPSLRTAAGLGLIGAGLYARNRRRRSYTPRALLSSLREASGL